MIVGGALAAGAPGAILGFVLSPLFAAIPALVMPGRFDTSRVAAPGTAGSSSLDRSHLGTARSGMDLIREGVPLVATSIWVSLLLTIDLLAVRAVGDATGTGLYGAAGALAHVPFYLLMALPLETLPRLAATADRAHRRALATRLLEDTAWMLAPCVLVLVGGGPVLFNAIFGAEYAAGAVLIVPLTLATAGVTIHAMLVAVDAARERLRSAVISGALATMVMGGTVALAAATRGLLAAAWAAALVAAVLAAAHWVRCRASGRVAGPTSGTLVALCMPLLLAALATVPSIGNLPPPAAFTYAMTLITTSVSLVVLARRFATMNH
jgi:O-antigen/teichoic acid export membrane protein